MTEHERWLMTEIERRRAWSEATGVDHLTEWLAGVNQGANPRDQKQGVLG